MKIFTNLPRNLRVLFGVLRLLTVVLAAFWFLYLTFGVLLQRHVHEAKHLIVPAGEVSFQIDHDAIGLKSDRAEPESLRLNSLKGTLYVNLWSDDSKLVSAACWTVFPEMTVLLTFSWVLFGSLRSVCANIEHGDVFSEKNLRLIRRIGVILIAYGLISCIVGAWAMHVMGNYLSQHAVLTGIKTRLQFPGGVGAVYFNLPEYLFSYMDTLITGCLVLVVSEAFRQGLALKTESDLTV